MERHFDFWHIEAAHVANRKWAASSLQPHADTDFSMNSLIVSFRKSCRLQPPSNLSPGCGRWTRPRGWYSQMHQKAVPTSLEQRLPEGFYCEKG
ncbi:hypothetical protein NQZ68_031713 [Dissostichus eleginoides]|nr:hypothetical protein NQZ68_031713 [Dissostichus eleginoides]